MNPTTLPQIVYLPTAPTIAPGELHVCLRASKQKLFVWNAHAGFPASYATGGTGRSRRFRHYLTNEIAAWLIKRGVEVKRV